jgi:hypothetical protein
LINISGRVASYGRQLDEIEKTAESFPFSSIILVNLAEIWLALGDRQKTEQLLKKSYTIIEERHMDFSDSTCLNIEPDCVTRG